MNSDDQDKPSNAQSAMLDYYDDVLGSLANDPLEELVQEELAAKVSTVSTLAKKKTHHSQTFIDKKTKSDSSLQRKKVRTKKNPPTFYDEAYEEKLKTEIVAPLIIPAAFPKMAPKPETKPEPVRKEPSVQAKTVLKEKIVEVEVVKEVKVASPKPKEKITSQPTINEAKPSNPFVNKPLESQVGQINKTVAELDCLPENGRPVWAQERFECLLFSVAGLKLAVPLISLGAIYKIESDFTPLVGRASWFMGLYRHDERNIRVVDTAQLVMPDRVVDTTRENYHYIIRLGGNNWGMACDSVQESIQLEPDAVKWRTERSKRAWLSGTVIDHMCALIDVDALSSILKKEALSKHSSFNA